MAERQKTTLRLAPDLHERVAAAAEAERRSVNNYVERLLDLHVPGNGQGSLPFEDAEAS